MNDTEHAFPLPEPEQHKLDEIKEEIVHPFSTRMRRVIETNAWTATAIATAAGLVCGLAWGRHGHTT